VLDCPDSIVSSVANDTPSAGQTTITLSGLLLTADAYNGLELRVVRPEAASNRLLYGEVLDTTSSTIVVQDDGSDSIYSALNSATQGFQVLDLPAAEASPSSTSGTWDLGAGYNPFTDTTSYTDFSAFSAAYIGMQLFPETDTYPNVSFTIIDVPDSSTVVVEGDTSAYGLSPGDPYTIAERCWRYDSVSDESDYFDADATFASYMVGWTFVPDISKPCYLPVIAVDAENGSITVKGDASGLAAPLTDRYHLIPPAGVARSTGALAKPEDAGDSTWNGTGSYDDPGAKWLWSGYLYVTPQVGHEVSGTTYGAQSGTNHLGQYHCNNRVYDINQGRWTSPDQASGAGDNVFEYVNGSPIVGTDPSGLYSTWMRSWWAKVLQHLFGWAIKGARPKYGYPTHNSVAESAMKGLGLGDCEDHVMDGTADSDQPGPNAGVSAIHVDSTKTMGDTATWIWAIREAGINMKGCCCMATLSYLAGMGAHTIGDFYHHTDWAFKEQNLTRTGGFPSVRRWDERASSAKSAGVQTGYGWEGDGAAQPGRYKHDPWGDYVEKGDTLPQLPFGSSRTNGTSALRLAYLWHVTWTTVIPHVRSFLNEVLGPHKECDCDCGGVDLSKEHLRACFGSAGIYIDQILRGQ
jgi:RHS repeat-associated protein